MVRKTRESMTVATAEVTIPVHRVDDVPYFIGRRQSWLYGEDRPYSARWSLTLSDEFGTPYVGIEVEKADGSTVYEYFDLNAILNPRVEAILTES